MGPTPENPERGGSRLVPRRGHALALLVLIGSVTLVIGLWRVAYERELRVAKVEFLGRTTVVAELLRQRVVNYELLTRGGAALFASVKRPTPQQWQVYVDGMGIQRRFPGMVGFGFAGYVSQAKLDALRLEWADAGYGELDVRPAGQRAHYGPILYLQPRTRENIAAIGFDMYSESTRHAAMERALQTGQAQLSGPVQLVQDGPVQTIGVLLALPVYRGGERPESAELRNRLMQGWVYVPLRMKQVVDTALDEAYRQLGFTIHDVTGEVPTLLFRRDNRDDGRPPAFHNTIEIEHYGRRWRLDFSSAPLAVAAPRLQGLQLALALGLLASLLMYAVAWALARTESRARRIALRLTEDFRRSELRFRTAMEHSAIGNALLDHDGRIVEANSALGTIVGRPPESLVAERFDSLFEDDDPHASSRESDRPDDDGVTRTTRRLHRTGGAARHAQLSYAPLPGNVGQDIAGLVQAEDVTERMRAQARVQALNRTLEARVALRTRELSLANQELETFAYSVSHDLRAPLRAIDGFSRALVERHGDGLDDAGRDYLARVRKAAARMGELIDAMLTMSRLSRGEFKPQSVDLSRMAAEVVEELRADRRAGERTRVVDVAIAPGLKAHGDAALLRNLLVNLIGNAWKFTREREQAHIEFGAQPAADGGEEFFVRDNGVGFSQAYVDKLFRPFQRLHAQEQFAGHGIGLASVKRIIERHGGTIRAEGREGEGATFWFTLPEPEGR